MAADPRTAVPSAHALRARYHSSDNNFAFRWPAVPARQFLAERDRAFAADAPTGAVVLDTSDALATDYPATTPTLLLRYLRVRAGESLRHTLTASGEIHHVIRGSGESTNGPDTVAWSEGDLFCFPGGVETEHRASTDALLLTGTNEPLLAFERLRPPPRDQARFETTHWPSADIENELRKVWARPITAQTTGHAVLFSSPALAPSTNTIPSVNVAVNTLEAGRDQRPHRHNGVALVLCIEGDGVYSMVDGTRIDWSPGAVQITPAASLHSHHNRGADRMRCLIFQDEALHYYTRTPGFSFD
ncbi:MAG: cupin domain-containing protein [Ectothiorhodospiraceae bacterium]|nr:cupin domain-containing protein [Chromatiales bacterium]MCP5156381.1 cupin domain-containing protein [Ectothiorhodospiraceae bacterium]